MDDIIGFPYGGGQAAPAAVGRPPTPVRLLSQAEVARTFHVTTTTVSRWAERGLLTCTRTSRGRRVYLPSDVEVALSRARQDRISP